MYTLSDSIKLPNYMSRKAIAKIIYEASTTEELMRAFNCKNSVNFSRFMKPLFPNRPGNQTYLKYLKSMLQFDSDPNIDKSPPKAEVVQSRIRTIDDIETSQLLWKEAGAFTRKQWLEKHPDPTLETLDNIFTEEDVFTAYS